MKPSWGELIGDLIGFTIAFAIDYVLLRYVLHVGHDLSTVGAWVLASVTEVKTGLARVRRERVSR